MSADDVLKSVLYKHYKGKYYRFLAELKDSEKLEDFVLYETLYENPASRLWIRPKQMFYSNVAVNSGSVARFQKVDLEFEDLIQPTKLQVARAAELVLENFEDKNIDFIYQKLSQNQFSLLSLCSIDKQIVGFKLGYSLSSECYYSWLGAVHKDFRGFKIATQLMEGQLKILKSKGFQKVQTKTRQKNIAMLKLNIQQGFAFLKYDSEVDHSGLSPKVILEKNLND